MYKNMRDIIILNCLEIPCSNLFKYVYTDIVSTFQEMGYKFKIIDNITHIYDNSIIFLAWAKYIPNPPINLLYKYAPNAIYMGWYWQDLDVSSLKYFIHMYENYLDIQKPFYLYNSFIKSKSYKNSCPILLRVNEHPHNIGQYERNVVRDYCYMGWDYEFTDHLPSKFNGIYHGFKDHKKYLTSEQCKEIALSSHFMLGFQCYDNTENGHVSKRIYEGLAFGCIVLTNSIPAVEQTNGVCIYITSKEEIEDKMTYYLNNREEMKKKQEEGYEFIKKYGTNYNTIDVFRKTIKDCFDIEI